MPVIDTPMLIEEAAEYLHTSQDSLREMAESGDVPAAKIGPNGGRVWIFTEETLAEFVRQEIKRQTEERRKKAAGITNTQPAARHKSGRLRPAPPPDLRGFSIA